MIARVSSSIENWQAKILSKPGAKQFRWRRDFRRPVVFFGLYTPHDWLAFMLHRGGRTVVWCGSDILQVGLVFRLLRRFRAIHICENEIEQHILQVQLGRDDIICAPLCFSDPSAFIPCFKPSKTPAVFMHVNRNAEAESGLFDVLRVAPLVPYASFHIYGRAGPRKAPPNVVFHGHVPEEQFNREIRDYQASWRAHEFDGMAETTAKSALLGQWPISKIRFPFIDSYQNDEELVALLSGLAEKTEPNWQAAGYYSTLFNNPPYDHRD